MSRVAAYEEFRARLLSGEISPGQFVTQRELAKLAGVPVGTAREAIQKLEHESLLKVHPQRGIQVADITTKFIRESYGLRSALELDAVRKFASGPFELAARALLKATQSVLEDLLETASDSALEQAVEVDWNMHDQIVASTSNDLFIETYQVNAARLRLIKVNNHLTLDRAAEVLREHIDILQHCIAKDADAAAAALAHHIDGSHTRALIEN